VALLVLLGKVLAWRGLYLKVMHQMLEYWRKSRDAFELESQGKCAHEPKHRAEWAKAIWEKLLKDTSPL
jgi:hypothetical protein